MSFVRIYLLFHRQYLLVQFLYCLDVEPSVLGLVIDGCDDMDEVQEPESIKGEE